MSRLVWTYEGKEEDRHGEQCALVGDTLADDVLGEVKAVRLYGAATIVVDAPDDNDDLKIVHRAPVLCSSTA